MNEDTNQSGKNEKLPVPGAKKAKADLFRALFLCFLAVVIVRANIVELFRIPSSSMLPTLTIGDHILVSKFNYGFMLPFSQWTLVRWAEPKRGEVIVFVYPKDTSLFYIKRVIGVPGDTIQVQGRRLMINGLEAAKQAVTDPSEIKTATDLLPLKGVLFREQIGDVTHFVQHTSKSESGAAATEDRYVVGPDEFFVMGDNRDDSYDSRSWGNVPRKNIRGKAQAIWLSVDHDANWASTEKYRWSRAFKSIH
jgi:signal peptidase I